MLRFVMSFFGSIFSMLTLGLLMAGVVLGGIFYMYGRDLPSYDVLATYTPKTISRIYSGEGHRTDWYSFSVAKHPEAY